MKHRLEGFLLALGLVVLLSWATKCSPPWDVAEAARLQSERDSALTQLTKVQARADTLLATNESVIAVVDSVQAEAASAGRRAAIMSNRHATLADSLQGLLGADTGARDVLDEIVAAHEATVAEKDEEVRLLASNVDRLRVRNDSLALALRTLSVSADDAVDALEAEVAFWRDAAESQVGGLDLGFIRVPEWVGYAAVAAGGVYLGTRF